MTERSEDLRWREICEAILKEPDQARLHQLIGMLNDELETRENRIRERTRPRRGQGQPNSQPEV